MGWWQDFEQFELVIRYGSLAAKSLLIVVGAWVALRYTGPIIDRLFLREKDETARYIDEQRLQTLVTLLKSLARYAVYFLAGVSFLWLYVPQAATSILAAAGIGGLAIGFGAQSLVRDVITGFFVILEDQFAVGEYVTAAGVSGIVEDIGLRVTRLRDFSGELHLIPNGLLEQVTNHSRGTMRVWVEIFISYEDDIDRAIAVMQAAADEMAAEVEDITEGPLVLGVTALTDSRVTIAVWAKTKSMKQWTVERELRRRLKYALDAVNIKLPYPRQVILSVDDAEMGGEMAPKEAKKEQERELDRSSSN
ncbi:MAG TPA: mechanosensitive ion channel family protein [Firmicutes bacterium]|nr:mechanosensitive ion channel family protein [Bacillota bacterium]